MAKYSPPLSLLKQKLACSEGYDDIIPGVLCQSKTRECGVLLCQHLKETGDSCAFVIISFRNVERAARFGGAEGNVSCWSEISRRIRKHVGEEAIIGYIRIGIAIYFLATEEDINARVKAINEEFSETPILITTGGRVGRIRIDVDIGYLISPSDVPSDTSFQNITRLLVKTTFAYDGVRMNSVMRRYNEPLIERDERRQKIELRVLPALEASHISLVMQPQLNFETNNIIGAEALARWYDPEIGLICPTEFVPIIEESEQLVRFTEYTIDSTVRFLAEHQNCFPPGFRAAVNLSQKYFEWKNADIYHSVREILRTHQCPASLLTLEITESAHFSSTLMSEVLSSLSRLKELGVKISVDDFGSGYGALALISSKVAQTIKIDRQLALGFIFGDNRDNFVITMLDAASRSGIDVIIEGVETLEQEAVLRKKNLPLVQGHLYAKPMPMDDFLTFIINHRRSGHQVA